MWLCIINWWGIISCLILFVYFVDRRWYANLYKLCIETFWNCHYHASRRCPLVCKSPATTAFILFMQKHISISVQINIDKFLIRYNFYLRCIFNVLSMCASAMRDCIIKCFTEIHFNFLLLFCRNIGKVEFLHFNLVLFNNCRYSIYFTYLNCS